MYMEDHLIIPQNIFFYEHIFTMKCIGIILENNDINHPDIKN